MANKMNVWLLSFVVLIALSLSVFSMQIQDSKLFVSIPYSEKNPYILNDSDLSGNYANIVLPLTFINISDENYKNGELCLESDSFFLWSACSGFGKPFSDLSQESNIQKIEPLNPNASMKKILSMSIQVKKSLLMSTTKAKKLTLYLKFSEPSFGFLGGFNLQNETLTFYKVIDIPLVFASEMAVNRKKAGFVAAIKGSKKCNTGAKTVPKMLFDWSPAAIDKDTCNASTGYFCDSTQFLLSILDRISKEDDAASFNVNLLGDAISADFIKDFYNYYSSVFFSGLEKSLLDDLHNGKIKIFGNVQGQVIELNEYQVAGGELGYRFEPGTYTVTKQVTASETKFILSLMPNGNACSNAAFCSSLYSLALDGDLGKDDKTRNGYGVVFKEASTTETSSLILKSDAGILGNITASNTSIQDNGNVIYLNVTDSLESNHYGPEIMEFKNEGGVKTIYFYKSVALPIAVVPAEHKVDDVSSYQAFYVLLNKNDKPNTPLLTWYGKIIAVLKQVAKPKQAVTSGLNVCTTEQNAQGLFFDEMPYKPYFGIFTVPYSLANSIVLKQLCPAEAKFYSPTGQISGQIGFNQAIDRIGSLDDLISMIKNEKVCLIKEQAKETYVWNAGALALQVAQIVPAQGQIQPPN